MVIDEIVKKLAAMDMWQQLNQTQEECGELITAINHYRRHPKSPDRMVKLCEEIADVRIMIAQCCMFLDSELIDKITIEKLARAKDRMSNDRI